MFLNVKLFKDIFLMFKLFGRLKAFVSVGSFLTRETCNIRLENDLL